MAKTVTKTLRKGMSAGGGGAGEGERDGEIPLGRMLRCRVRYFTDGAVIGSRGFVNEAFAKCRERFGPKRKDGARRMRGDAAAAGGLLWSVQGFEEGDLLTELQNPVQFEMERICVFSIPIHRLVSSAHKSGSENSVTGFPLRVD